MGEATVKTRGLHKLGKTKTPRGRPKEPPQQFWLKLVGGEPVDGSRMDLYRRRGAHAVLSPLLSTVLL